MAAVHEAVPEAATDPARPAFHFRPLARWMNDPNGTIHHGGFYHLFYQHNPFGDEWGRVHWGHARSRDLVEWEHLPIALAPSPELGEGHCFSGSAWRDGEGRPVLLYSSFPPDGEERPAEQWAVRCDDDLLRFEKSPANPVLAPEDHGGPRFGGDWRDPFVFEEEGRVFMILGVTLADEDDAPAIAVWEAGDGSLGRWEYRGILYRDAREELAFFECPNLSRLGEKHLLLYSAHRPVEYLLGSFSPREGRFRADTRGLIDHSPSLYATSLYTGAPMGRCVVVGWVRGWGAGRGWSGALSLPRVLSLGRDGGLRQAPLPGVEKLREAAKRLDARLLEAGESAGTYDLPGACLEVEAVLEPRAADGGGRCGIRLRRADDREPVVEIVLAAPAGPVEVKGRTLAFGLRPGEPPAGARSGGLSRSRPVTYPRAPGEPFTVRAFWDRSVLEVFLDEGRAACTEVLDTEGEPVVAEAFAEGGAAVLRSFQAWRLRSIW